ncbi:DUF4974 domain-containing protein [Chitinophaga sp. G-6-1-13]|uniref:DUF4974 domain-containing protein n=1 Tax=Chitinophaga fulva TaxID=2728842 RepID=A0A848GQ68_9BACT|nr:FecR family protein [Chitinophaga fulva]NML38790.1 DUF4974 domain-containing protein [Chitinophaga fulva]
MPTEKNPEYYRQLLSRWQQRTCTPDEAQELMGYLQQHDGDRTLLSELQAAFRQVKPEGGTPDAGEYGSRVREKLLQRIQAPSAAAPVRKLNKGIIRYTAAAALLAGLLLTAVWLLKRQAHLPPEMAMVKTMPVVTKGAGNKTVLTLANGEKIELDSAGIQQLMQGNSAVTNKDGQLIYEKTGSGAQSMVYNTLSTAAEQMYPLVLSDGSRIWLNAASTVRFPVTFSHQERAVELSGEAYFEIAPDARRPFRIKVGQMTVDVLGTDFNINAYPDEASINTTLVQGAVRVNSGDNSLQLAPGEQSQVKANGNIRKVADVNVSEIVAWKSGYFQFDNTDITSVMRQFSHWYNIEVVYEGKVKPRKFFGMISRGSSLANVLKMLQANDVTFRLEGKQLVIKGE